MGCSKAGCRHPFLTLVLVVLFSFDVFTDVATGVELILNDHHVWGWSVLGLVLLPVVVAILGELFRACIYGGCCGETTTDWIPLIFYHLYAIIMYVILTKETYFLIGIT